MVITDSEALRSFLDQQGVEVTTVVAAPAGTGQGHPEPTSASARDSRMPEWPPLVGGGVVLLGLTAGGAYQLPRRRPSPASAVVDVPETPPVTVPVTAPATAEPARDTRLVGRPVFAGAPAPTGETCSHRANAPGARFCGDCGTRLPG